MNSSNPFCHVTPALPSVSLVDCPACPRLVEWREAAAQRVPRRFAAWVAEHGFWARPVPAFGDEGAWFAIVGLAPATFGANRTGRMFTGDRSGDFLYAALHRAGLASMATSRDREDGLALRGVLITAALRCAPPGNRPTPRELETCRPYLRADLARLANLRVVLALGRIAHDAVLALLRESGAPSGRRLGGRAGARTPAPGSRSPLFHHGAEHLLAGGVRMIDSYHVSQRNTQTGLLTAAMFDVILERCRVWGEVAERQAAPRRARPGLRGGGVKVRHVW